MFTLPMELDSVCSYPPPFHYVTMVLQNSIWTFEWKVQCIVPIYKSGDKAQSQITDPSHCYAVSQKFWSA